MKKNTNFNYQLIIRLFHVFFWLFIIGAVIYILTIYLYPFLIGLILSLLFLPAVNFLENKLSWNRTSAVLLTISSFIIVFFAAFTLLIAEIAAGLSYLTKALPQYIQDGFEKLHLWFDTKVLPLYEALLAFSDKIGGEQQSTLHHYLETLLNDSGSQLAAIVQFILNSLADFLLSLPNTLTVLFFALLGAFFITKDWPVMVQWVDRKTPYKIKVLSGKMIYQLKQAVLGYAMAQLTLVCLTGIIVLAGLLIIGVDYAVTAALLIALVDVFPYLGTGLIFIPWIIYCFISGDWSLSMGLSILYGIVIVQRQIAEPKILSKHIGIPPLALLITLFASYQFFGVLGLLMGPALFIIGQSLIRSGVIEEVITYVKGSSY